MEKGVDVFCRLSVNLNSLVEIDLHLSKSYQTPDMYQQLFQICTHSSYCAPKFYLLKMIRQGISVVLSKFLVFEFHSGHVFWRMGYEIISPLQDI